MQKETLNWRRGAHYVQVRLGHASGFMRGRLEDVHQRFKRELPANGERSSTDDP